MRFSPTKILHGLLCTTPVLVLTLAACGGGGGSSDSPAATAYTLGGVVSAGLTSTGLVLRNNGGDDLSVAANAASFVFATKVVSNTPYNVTVLSHPSSPPQRCGVTNASGTMPAYDLPASGVPAVTVTCNDAFTIGGTINNTSGSTLEAGLVLQNKGGDNLLVPAGIAAGGSGTFQFSTPLVADASLTAYDVTVLAQPNNQKQTCYVTFGSGSVSANVNSVVISCAAYSPPSQADQYVYATNAGSSGTSGVSTYTSASGQLTAGAAASTGSQPNSMAVASGKYAYVANYGSNTISAYSISAGALAPLDMDPVTAGTQDTIATGTSPIAIVVHPSGKFAYVANYSSNSNSISAYSIDPNSGALASIDADGAAGGTQTSIPTRSNPISIAITPDGKYAYVANAGSNNISTYSIDATTGALTAIDADGMGTGSTNTYISSGGTSPYSITVDPSGKFLYTVNANSDNVTRYDIDDTDGSLNTFGTYITGAGPRSVAINPNGIFAYVANTNDDNVEIFSIDSVGGTLTSVTTVSTGAGSSPYSIGIDSTGQNLYVTNLGTSKISSFTISGATLTEVINSPFDAGSSPSSIATSR